MTVPMFSKRHYEAIAHCLSNSSIRDSENWATIIDEITSLFARDNPSFKSVKFCQAVVDGGHISASIKAKL